MDEWDKILVAVFGHVRHDEIIPTLILAVWIPGILPACYIARRLDGTKDPLSIIPALFWPISLAVMVIAGAAVILGKFFDVLDKLPARAFVEISVSVAMLGVLVFKIIQLRTQAP